MNKQTEKQRLKEKRKSFISLQKALFKMQSIFTSETFCAGIECDKECLFGKDICTLMNVIPKIQPYMRIPNLSFLFGD